MSYETMEQAYKQLTERQQKAIYEITLLLLETNKSSKPIEESDKSNTKTTDYNTITK